MNAKIKFVKLLELQIWFELLKSLKSAHEKMTLILAAWAWRPSWAGESAPWEHWLHSN